MSLFDCIENARRAGDMNGPRAKAAQELFRELEARYTPMYGAAAAAIQAARDVRTMLRESGQARRRMVLQQIQAQRRGLADLKTYRNFSGQNDMADAILAKLEWDQAATFESVSGVQNALRQRYHRQIAEVLEAQGLTLTGGIRNPAQMGQIVAELFGQASGNPQAKQMADAIAQAMETARLGFNAAGGNIGKLEDFGLPHSHHGGRIRAVGFDAWAAQIDGALDWGRIIDHKTGRPFGLSSPAARLKFLREIHDDITTEGWNKRKPAFGTRGSALYRRRADHRVLHFKDAEGWLAYNAAFGRADPFSTIVGHLDGMARDTALMRVLGPNPAAGLEYLVQIAMKQAQTAPWALQAANRVAFGDAVGKVKARGQLAKTMLGQITGASNVPGNERLAGFLANTRQFITGVRLGGAMLSAVGDPGFNAIAARHVGMDPGKVIGRMARLLADSGERTQALRMGAVAEHMANTMILEAQMFGDTFSPSVARRLAEFTMRASGLTAWTAAGRQAFQIEFFGFLADNAGRTWDELPDPLRRLFLAARGFDAADWDAIRATPLHTKPDGATFLIPDDIRTHLPGVRGEALATRLMAAIAEQTEFAVPNTSLRGRALVLGDTKAGTFAGELLRSGLMFKNFGLSLIFNHGRRALYAPMNGSRAAYIASFAAMTMISGYASLQLKEVAKGRDPRESFDLPPDLGFWGAVILQGGGLGIFGDFLQAGENRFGGGLAETLAGPVVGLGSDLLKFTVGNLGQLVQGEDTNAGREATKLLRQNTPGASLWYASLAANRLVFDTIQRIVDPEAEQAWRRAERRRIRDTGNASYWQPGAMFPTRGPDLNPFGGTP